MARGDAHFVVEEGLLTERFKSMLLPKSSGLRFHAFTCVVPLALLTAGCPDPAGRQWKMGQVELAVVDSGSGELYYRPIACENRDAVEPNVGDPVRFVTDPVYITIEAVHLSHLPHTLTGSRDVLVFADVWENASAGHAQEPTYTRVVAHARNTSLPGRLNFVGAPAYGPTAFKGSPLRFRLTILVLQEEKSEELVRLVELGESLIPIAKSGAPVVSEIANLVKAGVRAQPDVVALQFDAYLRSDDPEVPVSIEAPRFSAAVAEDVPDDARFFWLCYRDYALVETKPFGVENRLPGTRDRDGKLGGLAIRVNSVGGGAVDLAANYVVLKVDFSQPPEDSVLLEQAAKADRELVDGLTRSASDVESALDEVEQSSSRLAQAILAAEANRRARRAAKREKRKEKFGEGFDLLWGQVLGRFPAGSTNHELANFIGSAVKNRWLDRFEAVTPPEDTDASGEG